MQATRQSDSVPQEESGPFQENLSVKYGTRVQPVCRKTQELPQVLRIPRVIPESYDSSLFIPPPCLAFRRTQLERLETIFTILEEARDKFTTTNAVNFLRRKFLCDVAGDDAVEALLLHGLGSLVAVDVNYVTTRASLAIFHRAVDLFTMV